MTQFKIWLILSISLFFPGFFFTIQAQPGCDCERNLKEVIENVKGNYPGFQEKTSPASGRYAQVVDSLISKAQSADLALCTQLLHAYTHFFNDPHLFIMLDGTDNQISSVHKMAKKVNMDLVEKYLKKKQFQSGLEGIYANYLHDYRMAIIPARIVGEGEGLVGIIVSKSEGLWQQGQLKMKLHQVENGFEGQYLTRSYKPIQVRIDPNTPVLQFAPRESWYKDEFGQKDMVSNTDFEFQKLSAHTNLLRLPDFKSASTQVINKLVEKNKELIQKTPNLIIDLRDNPGGLITTFPSLVPLFYSSPITIPATLQLVSQQSLEILTKYAQSGSTAYREEYKQMAAIMEKELKQNHQGRLIEYGSDSTVRLSSSAMPAKVAFLINANTASAAELLLLYAAGSTKAVFMGSPSAGGTLYVDAIRRPLDCKLFTLVCPRLKHANLPEKFDKTGHAFVSVPILPTEPNWIEYALKYLESNK